MVSPTHLMIDSLFEMEDGLALQETVQQKRPVTVIVLTNRTQIGMITELGSLQRLSSLILSVRISSS